LKLRIAVIDDAGFGLGGGRGISGKEVYSELLARINEEYLGNEAFRVLLGRGIVGEGIKVYSISGSSIPVYRTIRDKPLEDSLVNLLKEIDIVHANIVNPRYFKPLINAVKRVDAKLVFTVHGYAPLCPIGWKTYLSRLEPCNYRALNVRCFKCMHMWSKITGSSPLNIVKSLYSLYAIREALKASNAIISPSIRFAEKLRDELDQELCSKVYTIHHPINPSLLECQSEHNASKQVLFIGRIEYEKGALLLPEIAKRIQPIELHVVGQGKFIQRVLSEAPSNLIYHGSVDFETKRKLLQNSSVVIVPSIYADIYNFVVVEAFACSKPVVAFDHGGPGELIRLSGGGFTAKPFNVEEFTSLVLKILSDEELRRDLGVKARRFVEEELHPRKYAEKLKKVYEDVLQQG